MNEEVSELYLLLFMLGFFVTCWGVYPYLNRKRFDAIKRNSNYKNSEYDILSISKMIKVLDCEKIKGLSIKDHTLIEVEGNVLPFFRGTANFAFGLSFGLSMENREVYFLLHKGAGKLSPLDGLSNLFEYHGKKDIYSIYLAKNIRAISRYLKASANK